MKNKHTGHKVERHEVIHFKTMHGSGCGLTEKGAEQLREREDAEVWTETVTGVMPV